MKFTITAGLLVVALVALYVTPAQSAPSAAADAAAVPVAAAVPDAAATPEATALALADPSRCGGSGGSGSGSGGGDLLDLSVLLKVDLSGLGKILNSLLRLVMDLLGGGVNKCQYKEYANKMQGLMVDLDVWISLLGINIQVQLKLLLGPLIQAVLKLVGELLNGVLGLVGELLKLVLGILGQLNLKLELDVKLQLGNLLNLDLDVLAKIL